MKPYLLLFILCILIACSSDDTQNLEETTPFLGELVWTKHFGGSGDDSPQAIITTDDGGFAIVGFTNSTDGDIEDKTTNINDFWLLKLDAAGDKQWSKTYGGSKDDRGQSVIQTTDGGFAIVGYAMSGDGDGNNNEGFHDNWILKLDSIGDIQWQHSFGFSGHDHSYDLIQTKDGGFFFVGFLDVTAANGEGNYGKKINGTTRHGVGEFWGTKLDAHGNLLWRRYFGGTNNDRAHSVVQAEDGGFVMAGFSESNDFDISNTKGSYDFWVIKISETGQLIWEKSFGGSGIEIAHDICKSQDNNYVITGHTFSNDTDISKNNGEADIWMIKINDQGQLLWETSFGGSQFDAAQSVSPTIDGGFVIAGNSKSTDGDLEKNEGENDLWIIKTDQNGLLVWQQTFGGTGLDFGFDALETSSGNLVLIGESNATFSEESLPKGGLDAVVIRIK